MISNSVVLPPVEMRTVSPTRLSICWVTPEASTMP